MPAEAEGIGHRRTDFYFSRRMGRVIQITFRIWIDQVDGRRDDSGANCHRCGGALDAASGS